MSAVIDRTLALLKWPLGSITLLLLPGAGWALYDLGRACTLQRSLMVPFVAGFAAYAVGYWLFLRKPVWGSLVSTFEHELTHAIFAWATLHRVVQLRATWRRGGHMVLRGEGNWLIAIAPYFFPTAAVLVALASIWLPPPWLPWANVLLGASVAYHVISTWTESHRGQPDLDRTGFTFAWMFLPTANLVSYGLVLAFALGGLDHASLFLHNVYARSVDVLGQVAVIEHAAVDPYGPTPV